MDTDLDIIKGQPVSHEVVAGFWEQGGQTKNQWMYYDVPLLWEFKLPDGRQGIAIWSESSTTDGVANYKRVRYNLFLFEDFPTFKAAVYDRNELIRANLAKATTIYVVDTCEYQIYKVLDVQVVKFSDLNPANLPTEDATLRWES